ncbi:MAG TPA: phosphoribosylanthranilate isomerase [Methylomirabilota bacterium]|jgi:phosphoribosylanthranilate isomerase|nr:phosphoribosylanthranilate isomerase [Methylomirabilota bacterium]
MTRVKVCGITSLDDARMAVQAGADALGFIFVENTPRFVTPEQVAPIVRRLPPFVTPVGVFWDHPAGHVKAVIEACGLRVVQFHGDEKPEDCQGYSVPVIKAIKLPPATTIDGLPEYRVTERFGAFLYRKVVAAYLLDSQARWSEGEGREPLEWRGIRMIRDMQPRDSLVPIVLSGGLTPENVAIAVDIVQPFAVDVNSGVEARPGKKDAVKLRRFIEAAKRA